MPSTYQRAAIGHRQGPAIVVSGPGSGKTTVLVDRVADLLRDGVRADRILCVTFSRDAAEEMRSRVAKITGLSEKTLRESISTFHSLALRILRSYGPEIITRPQVERLLREFIRKDRVAEQIAYNGRMRRALVSPEHAFDRAVGDETALAEVYGNYDETLRAENLIDFDSMVYRAVESLRNGGAEEWGAKFKYVILDEGQDTDNGQMRLAKLLSKENLMVVCDLSQEIYGFRGSAGAEILSSMQQAKHYFLPINYRSCSEIIEAFKPFAEQDPLSQELVSKMESACGAGGKVELHGFVDDSLEAAEVCQEINHSIIDGEDPKEHAVLARTRAVLLPYCEELERMGIPYHWRGKNFWMSPEIEDAMSFCRLAIDANDRRAWATAITSSAQCSKYLGRKFAAAVAAAPCSPLKFVPQGQRDYEIRQWQEMRDTVKSLERIADASPADFLRGMMLSTGLGVCDSQNEEPDDFRRENLDALIRRAEKFGTLLEFVRHGEQMKRRNRNAVKGVTLSTIHSAKGLEWSSVFVVGLTKDILPHKRSEDFNEERRLVYVALSRAKDRLWISYHKEKSVFISYLPTSIVEVSHFVRIEATA